MQELFGVLIADKLNEEVAEIGEGLVVSGVVASCGAPVTGGEG